jgi:hypothetical protein
MRIIFLAVSAVLGAGAAIVACSNDGDAPGTSAPDGGNRPDAGTGTGTDSGTSSDSSVPGPDASDAGDSGPGSMCPLPGPIGSQKCHTCVQAKCCTELANCNNDVDCKAQFLCISDCLPKPNPADCVDNCFATHPDASTNYTPFDTCVASDAPEGCADDCS